MRETERTLELLQVLYFNRPSKSVQMTTKYREKSIEIHQPIFFPILLTSIVCDVVIMVICARRHLYSTTTTQPIKSLPSKILRCNCSTSRNVPNCQTQRITKLRAKKQTRRNHQPLSIITWDHFFHVIIFSSKISLLPCTVVIK